jgi:Polysaccharide deacetylase
VHIADLEQERGLRSSFNIVGRWYDIDWGIVEELRTRGFEIGLHGIFHDRSLFSSRAEFERQQPFLREAPRRLGANGFRSPAPHRVHEWIAELPVAYDCTVPLSDPYEPQPGGSCSQWPFSLGSVVELPYTLPQDHTLFTLLGHRTIDLWRGQVEQLERSHGLVQCVTHSDPGYLGERMNQTLYAEFLDFLAERDSLWHALPREVGRGGRSGTSAASPRNPASWASRGSMIATALCSSHPNTAESHETGLIAIAWRGALHDYDWAEANQSRSPGASTGRSVPTPAPERDPGGGAPVTGSESAASRRCARAR